MEENQQKKSSEIYYKVYTYPIKRQYLIPIVKPTGYVLLAALACFIDKNNKCFPSQNTIAKMLGIRNTTAIRTTIKRLCNTKFANEPVLRKIPPRTADNNTNHNVYIISNKIGIKMFKGEYDNQPIDGDEHFISAEHNLKEKTHRKETTYADTVLKDTTCELSPNKIQEHNENQLLKEDLNVSNKQEAFDVYKFSLRRKYKHLKEKIYDRAIGLHEFNPEYSLRHAVNIVTRHIDKLGEENWLKLLKIAEEHESLKTYLGVTYSVIEKNNTFEDAVEECASY